MLFERAIIFQPKKLHNSFVYQSNYPLTEHFLEFFIGEDEFVINTVHLKSSASKGLVFFLHGTLNHIQYNIPRVEEYLKNNFDVVIMDYPGYGKSKGKLTEKLLHEVVEVTFEKMIKDLEEDKMIIVAGRSLGTALASRLAIKANPHKLILISPYYNMPDLFRHHGKLFSFNNLKFRLENDVHLSNVQCETYIFHGNKDRLIPVKLSRKLLPLLKEQQNFIEIPDADHLNVHETTLYKESIKKILS